MDKLPDIDALNEKLWNKRFEDSSAAGKESLINLIAAKKAGYLKGMAYASLNIAATAFLSSDNDSALKNLSEAFRWFRDNCSEKGYARALLLEGNIYESFGDYEKTLTLWLEALKVSKNINDISSEAEACNQLGLVYFRLSNYPRALEYLNSGLVIREELNDENAVASSLNRIGMVLRQMKKFDESLEYYFRSLEIREKNKQFAAIPWTLLGIASTYEDSGNIKEALEYYKKGLNSSDRRCVLQCMIGAGRIHSINGNKKEAEKLLTDSLKIAKDLKTLYLMADAYSALSKHFEAAGQSSKALENYKLFQQTRESLLSEEAQSRLSNIEISHAIEKSEQEKEIYRLKNVELKKAYDIIEEKNRDITASISYASRIQNAILPKLSDFRKHRGNIFILWLPKDIVSGDFFWVSEINEKFILVAGDCTGHGVPGALMSMLGISFLEEIVNKREILDPGIILDELGKEIRRSLKQNAENSETKDGMDIAVCIIDRKLNHVTFAGANNGLYLIRNNNLTEYRADHMAAGYNDDPSRKFTKHEIDTSPGDILYMYSDGFADQFGGPSNKKYKYSAFRQKLLEIHSLPLKDQKKSLENEFNSWKGGNSQVDDVLIVGYTL